MQGSAVVAALVCAMSPAQRRANGSITLSYIPMLGRPHETGPPGSNATATAEDAKAAAAAVAL